MYYIYIYTYIHTYYITIIMIVIVVLIMIIVIITIMIGGDVKYFDKEFVDLPVVNSEASRQHILNI